MEKDRKAICDIISEMFKTVDAAGIYSTSTAFTRLEHYIEQQRIEAIGWTHAFACTSLDKGGDPRIFEVPSILDAARRDLSK